MHCVSPVGIPANAKAADGGAARSALKQRVLTALVLVPLLLASLFLLPGIGWQLLTCLPIALAAGEWARLGGFRRTFRVAFVGIVLASCLAFVAAFLNIGNWGRAGDLSHLLLVAALMFWTIAVPLWLYRGWRVTQPLLFGAVGWTVLVPAWLAAVFLQRSPWLLLATLLVVWIADTAAYFARGMDCRYRCLFCRPPLRPPQTRAPDQSRQKLGGCDRGLRCRAGLRTGRKFGTAAVGEYL